MLDTIVHSPDAANAYVFESGYGIIYSDGREHIIRRVVRTEEPVTPGQYYLAIDSQDVDQVTVRGRIIREA